MKFALIKTWINQIEIARKQRKDKCSNSNAVWIWRNARLKAWLNET